MERRKSGIYEFRQLLPQAIAGKIAPPQVVATVPELVNSATGRFKRDLTVSLSTTDYAVAKRKNNKEALRVSSLFLARTPVD